MHWWKVLSLRYQSLPPFMCDEPQLQQPPHHHTSTSPGETVGRRVKSEPGWLVPAHSELVAMIMAMADTSDITTETERLRRSEAIYNKYLVQRWATPQGAATFCPQCHLLMMPYGGGFHHLTPWRVQTSQDASFSTFLWHLRQSFTHHDYSVEKSTKREGTGRQNGKEEKKGEEENGKKRRRKWSKPERKWVCVLP